MAKKTEFILAVDNEYLDSFFHQGVTTKEDAGWFQDIQPGLVIRERDFLETCKDYRQIIPYVVVRKPFKEGEVNPYLDQFFVYQRGKGVGESRLEGNYTFGIGGHVDAKWIMWDESVLNLGTTIHVAAWEEIYEEIDFTYSVDAPASLYEPFIFIKDDSDEVGEVHFGIVFFLNVAPESVVQCKEPELQTIGFKTLDEMEEMGVVFESWSELLMDYFRKK